MKNGLSILILMCMIFTFVSCSGEKTNTNATGDAATSQPKSNISSSSEKDEINELTFVKLPSPPVCKKVTKKEDIEKIINFLENEPKENIPNNPDIVGWRIFITDENGTLNFSSLANSVEYQGKRYTIGNDYESKLLDIYKSLDYPETDYVPNTYSPSYSD